MVLCMDYLIVFLNFEYLLNLDREICLAKEINILILIMRIKFVMAVIKGIGRGKRFAVEGELPYFVSFCHRSFFCLHI